MSFYFYFKGPAYLDENVSPRAAPVYIGIWFCCTMLGPPIGMIIGGVFLGIFTDLNKVSFLFMYHNQYYRIQQY